MVHRALNKLASARPLTYDEQRALMEKSRVARNVDTLNAARRRRAFMLYNARLSNDEASRDQYLAEAERLRRHEHHMAKGYGQDVAQVTPMHPAYDKNYPYRDSKYVADTSYLSRPRFAEYRAVTEDIHPKDGISKPLYGDIVDTTASIPISWDHTNSTNYLKNAEAVYGSFKSIMPKASIRSVLGKMWYGPGNNITGAF